MDTQLTLGYHRDMAAMLLGENSPAVAYMDEQISKAPRGRDEEVVAAESQVVGLLISMHNRDKARVAALSGQDTSAELQ